MTLYNHSVEGRKQRCFTTTFMGMLVLYLSIHMKGDTLKEKNPAVKLRLSSG
jgi:hypothetical protein